MIEQDIFNKVVTHLRKQRRKSVIAVWGSIIGKNRYRHDGLSCAIGCLVTDDAYDVEAEGVSIRELSIVDERWFGFFSMRTHALAKMLNQSGIPSSTTTKSLLLDLQHVHDLNQAGDWERELHMVATNFNLIFPELP